MLRLRWSIQSPLSTVELTDRVLTERRWNGWRDGFADARFLIAEKHPVVAGPDGFCFVVPSSPKILVVCKGSFHSTTTGTRIDLTATPQRAMVVLLAAIVLIFSAVIIIGLWPVSPWLGLILAFASSVPTLGIYAFGFWLNAKRVQPRINEFLTLEHRHKPET